MSMVTLQDEMNNHNIEETTVVKVNVTDIQGDEHSAAYHELSGYLNHLHGREMTLFEFMETEKEIADSFEWSFKDGIFTHRTPTMFRISGSLKFIIVLKLEEVSDVK